MDNSIIAQIIPPPTRDREGFSNERMIDKLDAAERGWVEDELIAMLSENIQDADPLVIETLAYLKSEKSLPILYEALYEDKAARLLIASSIYTINGDDRLVDVAITAFRQLPLLPIWEFYPLAKFNRPETDAVIREYVDHKDYLVSYNAKRALELYK